MTITILDYNEKTQLYDIYPEEILEESDICVGALSGEELHGILTARSMQKGNFNITFLHVDESLRRQGTAQDMLRLLCQTVRVLGAEALTMSFFVEDKDDALLPFAEKNGFKRTVRSGVITVPLSAVSIALDKLKSKEYPGEIIPLSKVTEAKWKEFRERLLEIKDDAAGEKTNDLYMDPGSKSSYNKDISFLSYDKKKIPTGGIFMREDEGFLVLDYLISLKRSDAVLTMNLVRTACEALEERYSEIKIKMHAFSPEAKKLAVNLLGKYAKESEDVVHMVKYL